MITTLDNGGEEAPTYPNTTDHEAIDTQRELLSAQGLNVNRQSMDKESVNSRGKHKRLAQQANILDSQMKLKRRNM